MLPIERRSFNLLQRECPAPPDDATDNDDADADADDSDGDGQVFSRATSRLVQAFREDIEKPPTAPTSPAVTATIASAEARGQLSV